MEETRVLKANLSEKSPFDFLVDWVKSLAYEGMGGVWDVTLDRGDVRSPIAVFSPSWVGRLKRASLFETFRARGLEYPDVAGSMLCFTSARVIDDFLVCLGPAPRLVDELLSRETTETTLTARRIADDGKELR